MLDQFQVRDLPLVDVVVALESAPLKAVVGALEHGSCRAVLVLDLNAVPRGLVMRDAVLKHADRLSDLRVGLLPAIGVIEAAPELMLKEAARLVSAAGVGAIVCRRSPTCDLQVMFRDEMLNLTDWAPLLDARTHRIAAEAALHSRPRRTPPVIAL